MAQSGINVKYDPAHKIIKLNIFETCASVPFIIRLNHSNSWPGTDILYILASLCVQVIDEVIYFT